MLERDGNQEIANQLWANGHFFAYHRKINFMSVITNRQGDRKGREKEEIKPS